MVPLEAVERRYVLRALALVVAVLALLAVAEVVRDATAEEPVRIAQVRRCFFIEKQVAVFELPVDSPLAAAGRGGMRAIVETNEVQVAIADSEQQAARLSREVQAGAPPEQVVERRGDVVVVWAREPSPTQRQALSDCSY